MQRMPVSSTTVADVGYDAERSTLGVGFHTGSVYEYYAVPPHVASALVNAPSVGRYLAVHVKGRYEYLQIG
jgi:hypothetical protein